MLRRRAFSLVELLVVVAVIGILIALLLPAIQAARESARRSTCMNHLKQLALAVQSYHDAHKALPSLFNGVTAKDGPRNGFSFGLDTFSWQTQILPLIEQQNLQNLFNNTASAIDPANQPVVNQVLPLVNCPSTPRTSQLARGLWYDRGKFNESLTAATTDYGASSGYMVGLSDCIPGAWGEIVHAENYFDNPKAVRVSFNNITDGLSQTLLLLERAALPDRYMDSGATVEPQDPPKFRTWGNIGLWAISGDMLLSYLQFESWVPAVNGDNLHGPYSFHPGGALVAFADGAVQLMPASLDTETVVALITRDSGEVVDPQMSE
jgi:prepilin-type N-terminal cleavage/methylation domain-containing protein